MANTYRKVYLQIVFAVKGRQCLLDKAWRNEVFKYMAGIINKRGHYSLAVNGYQDHVHLFLDYSGKELIEDLVREVKKASNSFIQEKGFLKGKFQWQSGYGVFSHGYREKEVILEYVKNQEEHHRKKTFKEEYLAFLKSYEVEFREEYLFTFIDS